MTTKRYIFVCSGNICRSPLAAGLAKSKLEEADIAAVVISAGTLNINGQQASSHSITVGAEYGVDISQHRSQGLSRGLAEMADALVVMAPNHVEAIKKLSVNTPVVELWKFEEGCSQIEDPVGKNLETYRTAGELIDRCLDRWVLTL